jgi:hypothetical protein
VAAAWLFSLSLPTIENAFTVGKGEPLQLVLWLAALVLLARGERLPWVAFVVVGASVLVKETALLLGFPALVATWIAVSEWRQAARGEWRRRALPLVAVWAVLAVCGSLVTFYTEEHWGVPSRLVDRGRIAIY